MKFQGKLLMPKGEAPWVTEAAPAGPLCCLDMERYFKAQAPLSNTNIVRVCPEWRPHPTLRATYEPTGKTVVAMCFDNEYGTKEVPIRRCPWCGEALEVQEL